MEHDDSFLTLDEWLDLDTLLVSKDVTKLEAPQKRYELRLGVGGTPLPGEFLVAEQWGSCRLSDATRKAELARIAKAAQKRKGLRERKPYTRKRGTVHPKKKQATLRRNREANWATNPLACILYRNRYKCKSIDTTLWNRIVTPLWVKYDPKELTIEFPATAGTRAVPWTMYNMVIKHRGEVVYKGEDQLLYDLSSGQNSEAGSGT